MSSGQSLGSQRTEQRHVSKFDCLIIRVRSCVSCIWWHNQGQIFSKVVKQKQSIPADVGHLKLCVWESQVPSRWMTYLQWVLTVVIAIYLLSLAMLSLWYPCAVITAPCRALPPSRVQERKKRSVLHTHVNSILAWCLGSVLRIVGDQEKVLGCVAAYMLRIQWLGQGQEGLVQWPNWDFNPTLAAYLLGCLESRKLSGP